MSNTLGAVAEGGTRFRISTVVDLVFHVSIVALCCGWMWCVARTATALHAADAEFLLALGPVLQGRRMAHVVESPVGSLYHASVGRSHFAGQAQL